MGAIKYTDRDVRDHPEFYETVVNYLENYTGEFAFIIDCKMRVASGAGLSVGMVRGVLNCMRADPRVDMTKLPEPGVFATDEAVVVPIHARQERRRKKKLCDITEFHERHGGNFDDDEFYYCEGRYAIQRVGEYYLEARIRPHLVAVVAKTGSAIHRVKPIARVLWVPADRNGFGFGWRYNGQSGDLIYETNCKFPSVIRNGLLLTEERARFLVGHNREPLDKYLTTVLGRDVPPSQRKPLKRCTRCSW